MTMLSDDLAILLAPKVTVKHGSKEFVIVALPRAANPTIWRTRSLSFSETAVVGRPSWLSYMMMGFLALMIPLSLWLCELSPHANGQLMLAIAAVVLAIV